MKRFDICVTRNCRLHGGLYLGVKVNFPMNQLYENGEVRSTTRASVGLVFWTAHFEFRGRNERSRFFTEPMRLVDKNGSQPPDDQVLKDGDEFTVKWGQP